MNHLNQLAYAGATNRTAAPALDREPGRTVRPSRPVRQMRKPEPTDESARAALEERVALLVTVVGTLLGGFALAWTFVTSFQAPTLF